MTTTRSNAVREFREVYADCIIDPDDPDMGKAMRGRTLQWRGDRISLPDAAWWYSQLPECEGYNPSVLPGLLAEFPFTADDPGERFIEVTPAREYSTCMYLHVADEMRDKVEAFVRENFGADEVNWQRVCGSDTLRIWWD